MTTTTTSLLAICLLLSFGACDKVYENPNSPDDNHIIEVSPGGGATDIDENFYPTTVIGPQEWMAANLKTTRYANGDSILHVSDPDEWKELVFGAPHFDHGAWCYYENDEKHNLDYGKLYNWHAVADERNLCPINWRVPSDEDWHILAKHLDPKAKIDSVWFGILVRAKGIESEVAGGYLKSGGDLETGTGLWQSPNEGASNQVFFNAQPAGGRLGNQGNPLYNEKGQRAAFWSSTEPELFSESSALYRLLNFDKANLEQTTIAKTTGMSVRCVRD